MRLRTKVFLVFLALVAAAVLYGVWLHYRLKGTVESYRRELVARGEKVTIAELTPLLPTNGPNGAGPLLSAAARFSARGYDYHLAPATMRYITNGRARVAWSQEELIDSNGTNLWPGVAKALEARGPQLAVIRLELEKPVLWVALDYQQGFLLRLPHLAYFKAAAQWLSASAVLNLHEGNSDSAAEDLRTLTRLVRNYGDEPLLISQLVSLAMRQIALGTIWEALHARDLSEETLAEIQSDWETMNGFRQLDASFCMERAMVSQLLSQLRVSYAEAQSTVTSAGAGTPAVSILQEAVELGEKVWENPKEAASLIRQSFIGYLPWKWWWSYQLELEAWQVWQAFTDTVRETSAQDNWSSAIKSMTQTYAPVESESAKAGHWGSVFTEISRTARDSLTKFAGFETQRRLLVTAIAIRRYELLHGKPPETLGDLVPQQLSAIQMDPMDGKPLRYRPNPDGTFVLYSVGLDGVDDGGDTGDGEKPERLWWRKRDAVWPQPATPEQVREYQAELVRKSKYRADAPASPDLNSQESPPAP